MIPSASTTSCPAPLISPAFEQTSGSFLGSFRPSTLRVTLSLFPSLTTDAVASAAVYEGGGKALDDVATKPPPMAPARQPQVSPAAALYRFHGRQLLGPCPLITRQGGTETGLVTPACQHVSKTSTRAHRVAEDRTTAASLGVTQGLLRPCIDGGGTLLPHFK